MKTSKRIFAALLAVLAVFSLSACASDSPQTQQSQQETQDPAQTPAQAEGTDSSDPQPEDIPAESGKTLVVYYSASGNTKRVAEDIAEAADADLFEITPTEVYTSDDLNWRDADSRVSREHDDESLRDVPLTTTEVPNWDAYDTVFLGYPIWWGGAAWPVNGSSESQAL